MIARNAFGEVDWAIELFNTRKQKLLDEQSLSQDREDK